MTVEFSAQVEKELHDLAERQGRKVQEIVEEAVREYLEAVAITDLASEEIEEAQVKLIGDEPKPQRVIGQDDGLFEVPDDFDAPLIPTSSEDILGCMSYRGPAKTLEEMEAGIAEGARESR